MRQTAESLVQERYQLFDTRMGACGIAWSERGLTRLQLPERTPAATERRLRSRPADRGVGKPPAQVGDARLEVVALAEKELVDAPLDLGLQRFEQDEKHDRREHRVQVHRAEAPERARSYCTRRASRSLECCAPLESARGALASCLGLALG